MVPGNWCDNSPVELYCIYWEVVFSPVCLLVWGISVSFGLGDCPITPCFEHVRAGGGGGLCSDRTIYMGPQWWG